MGPRSIWRLRSDGGERCGRVIGNTVTTVTAASNIGVRADVEVEL